MKAYFEDIQPLEAFQWQFLHWERSEDTLILTLNVPERRNALNPILLNELAYALAYAHTEGEIRFVRLRGNGDIFCSGADLRALMEGIQTASTVPTAKTLIVIDDLLTAFEKPLIAEVTGDVLAGGMLLLTGATFVIAFRGCRFSLPEVRRGLFPFQVLKALAQCMPPRLALGWCLLGTAYTAEVLHSWGIVTHLVEDKDAVLPAGDALIKELRLGAPLAMQRGIHAYRRLDSLSHAELNALLVELAGTEDAREGILAFREKRKPQWKGR
ncbi:MAG: enoyl-CoA hydratase-related protein [Bacteroidia bacterium]|nr:enoyl-CoA hydratase-related protein [Bacteroidia bacterium]